MTEEIENRYAIVGIGGIFPDAPNMAAFWQNILDKRVSIDRLPEDSDERRIYFRPEVLKKIYKEDKSYTDVGAAIDVLEFDSEKFRIPPSVAKHMDENQKVALMATEQALAGHPLDSVAKERTSVILGGSGYGALHHDLHRRIVFERVIHHLQHESFDRFLPRAQRQVLLDELKERVLAGTFGLTEDSAPGMLPSIMAGRIMSVFDLHGRAIVVDAACASALAALSCSIQELELGRADAVICGAVDMPIHEVGRIYFSAINALSPDGSFPFDARANGFVIGQGGGVFVLKRLQDAIEAGNRIFAVVAGHGLATDGKGKAIAAPNEVWQAHAIRSAYEAAGYPVDTVELIEAHGTSTQVGDKSEVNALKRAFRELGCKRSGFCGIGSVKSNIGHLKTAAGIAGLLKATLALHHKWLPPTASFERLSPAINLEASPFYVLAEGKAWPESSTPRRAGVSSFGFGGVNYHVALEEYRPDFHRARPKLGRGPARTEVRAAAGSLAPSAPSSMADVAFFAAADTAQLLAQVGELHRQIEDAHSDVGDLLASRNARTDGPRTERLAFAVRSRADLVAKLDLVRACQPTPEALSHLHAQGIHYSAAPAVSADQVAVLFPGQGSQYPGMLGFVRARFLAAQTLAMRANRLWQHLAGMSVTELIDAREGDEAAAEARLRETANTHPAVMTTSLAAYAVLEQMGLRPAVMLGHSLGEYSALVAAGRLSLGEGLALMRARGKALSDACAERPGAMLALPVDEEAAAALIREAGLPLTVANRNSPRQTILAGDGDAVEKLYAFAVGRGHRAIRLNVSRAFHSPLMQNAERTFAEDLAKANFRSSRTPVVSCVDAQVLGATAEAVQRTLSTQMTSRVDFVAGIERLYADGVRLFVEVGPSSVLAGLTREILGKRPGLVLSCDGRKADSDEAFLRLLCGLHTAGLPMDPTATPTVEPRATHLERAEVSGAPSALEGQNPSPAAAASREDVRIVYSGVSVGLPGSFKDAFRDDNFQQLFEGRNFIERLSDDERRALLDLHISKVVKSEQGAAIVELRTLGEVIQLAGKLGRLDLAANYQVDAKELETMSTCVAHAVAAGFEALRDARIPLVLEYTRTTSGRLLPERWALPRDMQASTGIIFANGFPLVEPVIAEVSRHLGQTLGNRNRDMLRDFYEGLIAKVTDADSRKLLTDWFARHYGRLAPSPDQEQVYRFNHQFMTQISMQANNRLARRINARGPNFQLNAACSSAATAVMLAEELIKGRRAQRMIIIGADDPTSEASLPYLGAGFLSTGACTSEADLYEAAVPFDKRRNGMIMGAGAVGIVVEAEDQCVQRGVVPVCELLGTHSFNAASHGSQLDVARYADELERFLRDVEHRHGIARSQMAPELVYFSHEPYTPPRGGCSEAEAVALRHVFGAQVAQVEVTNTKGMTGHTMGASIEDVAAAKALQFGRVPPVVNHKVPDPSLAGLTLSSGSQRRFTYALRMAAGFGSQGNYVLLRRSANGDARLADETRYEAWLQRIACQKSPELTDLGRLLVVKDTSPGAVVSERPAIDCAARPAEPARPSELRATLLPPSAPSADMEGVRERVLDIVARITGYKRSLLDLDMELEADLGVDTVKQATTLSTLAESFGITDIESIHLSDYPTLRALVELFARKAGPAQSSTAAGATSELPPRASGPAPGVAAENVTAIVAEIVAEVTGYRLALVEPSMELEADLGVDTVKQATILGKLAERFGLTQDPDSFRISDFPTVGHLATFFAQTAPSSSPARPLPAMDVAAAPAVTREAPPESPFQAPPQTPADERTGKLADAPGDIPARIIRLLTECTPYPAEMLEPELTLDSDLGLDAGARERFRSACIEAFDLDDDWLLPLDARIADLPALLTASPRVAATQAGEVGPVRLARQVPSLRPAPLAGRPELLSEKHVWIWGDDPACVESLAASLTDLVGKVQTMAFPASGSPKEALHSARRLGDSAPDVLLDLTACGSVSAFEAAEPELFHRALARSADCRFALWKSLVEKKMVPARTIAVTAIDGAHGLAGLAEPPNPLYGLSAGFYKAVRKLVPGGQVAILDLPPSAWAASGSACWTPLLAELAQRGSGVEVCYRDGLRHRVVLADAEPPAEGGAQPPSSKGNAEKDEVIVATGGGAGITAAMLKALVQRFPCHVALIGRTALGAETRRFHALPPEAREAEKESIRERLLRSGKKATPVLVDRAYASLVRAAEIYETLAALEAAGAQVTYHEADVCDSARLQSVLAEVRRVHGPITTIVHGAGIEVSRTIDKKTLEEFQSVHRTKTLGAWNLSLLCRNEPVRKVVAISSIAGRLGSPAQIDYSAANGFLDLWARRYQRGPTSRGLSLIWSAWAEQGMAWRNTFVRDNAERSGLGFIDPGMGARAAVREILADSADVEVVLHRGLGDLLDPELAEMDRTRYPFLDWVERNADGRHTLGRHFSPRRDAMLDQHRLGKTSLMPGVGLMEMMAEAHALMAGEQEGALVFRQLEFVDALKFYRDGQRDVQVRISSASGATVPPRLHMEVWSPFRASQGALAEDRLYTRAHVSRENVQLPAESPATWILGKATQRMSFAQAIVVAAKLRQGVNLGPLLNESSRAGHDTSANEVILHEGGIVTRVQLPKAQLTEPRYPFAGLHISPAFLDCMHQAPAIYSILSTGSIYLPVGAEQFTIFEAPNRDSSYDVIALCSDRSSDRLWFDVGLLREGKHLCCLARKVVLRKTGQ